MTECTHATEGKHDIRSMARNLLLQREHDKGIRERAIARGEIKVKAYHKANKPRKDLPYVEYHPYSPPIYRMINMRWVKVKKGVPLRMVDDCARKIFKMAKKASRANKVI